MKHTFVRLTLIVSVILICTNKIVKAQCTLDKTNWYLYFSEEFSGNKASLSNNWAFQEPPYTSTDGLQRGGCNNPPTVWDCYDPNMVNVSNGLGIFSLEKAAQPFTCNPSQPMADYRMSTISSKAQECFDPGHPDEYLGYAFGMFEIRCSLTKKCGSYNAFWLSGVDWNVEIDGFERHGGNNDFFSTIHWYDPITQSNASCSNFFGFPALNLMDEWHTFTIVWTPTEVSWFLDGKELKTDNDPNHLPNSEILLHPTTASIREFFRWGKVHIKTGNGWICPGGCWDDGTYDDFYVDYIRVYKPNGSPQWDANQLLANPSNNYMNQANESYIKSYYQQCVTVYGNTPYKTNTDWISNVVIPQNFYPVDDSSEPKTWLRGIQGGGKFFYKGKYDLLWVTYWSNGVMYNEPVDWNHTVDGDIAVIDNATASDYTFYRSGNDIYYVHFGTVYHVANVNDALDINVYDNISRILPKDNATEFFYVTTGNTINYTKLVSGSWSVPISSPATNVLGSTIFDCNNQNRIYYVSLTNTLCFVEWDPNTFTWSNGQLSSVNDVQSDLAISLDGNTIFYKSTSNELKYFHYQSGIWSNYGFQAKMWGTGSPTTVNTVMWDIVVGKDPNNPQYYFVGTDSKVWVIYYDGTDYTAIPINPSYGKVFSNLTLINGTSDTRLAYVGSDPSVIGTNNIHDYRIRTLYWGSPCDNVNPPCNTTNPPIITIKKGGSTGNSKTDNSIAYAKDVIAPGNSDGSVKPDIYSKSIKLFPNPSKDVSYITGGENVTKLILSSIDGRIVNELPLDFIDDKISINLTNKPQGLYILSVQTKDNIQYFKLTKY